MARDDLKNQAGSSNNYDPDEIYLGGSKDDHGHSANLRCHVPDTWMAVVAELVSSRDWPEYKTPQHFFRDAIYHRMQWAVHQAERRQDPKVRTLMALALGEGALQNAKVVRTASERFVTEARSVLSQMVSDGNAIAVRETIKELEDNLTDLQEPWRTQMRQELENWERRIQTM